MEVNKLRIRGIKECLRQADFTFIYKQDLNLVPTI